ncbi:MAG TPA: PTS mannose transporter subunit IIAB [Candidatus Bariatricus faecipullorum]|nr:PTS mannose transporter subunit IIAB [Candidatus Bariatricus faecipullorum]
MYKIIIFTHDVLSKGLLQTSRIIMGEQPDMETWSVEPGCNLDDLKEQVGSSLESSEKAGQEVLVLSDLMYGTPFNILVELQEKYQFCHITGVNLPMLLEAVNQRGEEPLEQVTENIIKAGKESIFDCKKLLSELEVVV